MALRIAQITLLNGVQSIVKTFPTGIKGYLIGNESGFTCDVQLENGDEKILYPGYVDYFAPGPGFSGIIFIRPSINIQTAILYPSQTLWVDAVSPIDDISASSYPMALPRPMTAGTSSPQSGFSCAPILTVSAAPTNHYGLNMFNPLTSGVIARIFSARMKVPAGDIPTTTPKIVVGNVFVRTDGTDNNFATAVKIFAHNILNTALPVPSQMHLTAFVDTAIAAPNVFLWSYGLDNAEEELLGPPDAFYLNPGQNVAIDVQFPGLLASSRVFPKFAWTEQ